MNEIINDREMNEIWVFWTNTQWILTLDWLDLSWINIKATNIQDWIETDLSSFNTPQNNWRGFLSYYKRWRKISMTVYIKWETESEFISNLDNFRKACFKEQVFLDWKKNWKIRRIKVNCISNPQDFQHYNIDFLKVNVVFTSLEPFWYNIDYQSTNIFSQSSSFQEEITSVWNARADTIAYIIFWNTNSTQVKMKVWENEIIIDNQFSNWDILKIDSEKKRVYIWEDIIDYNWVFPYMESWTNFFNFTINWDFVCDVLVLNKKNYV